jgi:FtsP/CotA-like multicopper oxidase with cupredoxin domain
MSLLTRRNFLKYAGILGIATLSEAIPSGFRGEIFSEDVKEFKLNASITTVNVGTGKPFKAWTYNGQLPGPEIRLKEGKKLRAVFKNYLPEGTTIHWHGLPVPNNMDGVPNITQKPVQTGQSFIYEFNATPPGTYIYHTHASYQLDQGLYGALVIEPKKEERSYDREYVLMLEAWATIDGGGPEASRMGRISTGMGMMGGMMGMMGRQSRPGEPLHEPLYDAYGINGKVFNASVPFKVRKGDRVRLRIINASSSTIYTFRIAGHSLTITHTDGRPVVPFEVDALRIGQSERYDVELYANNPGRWQIYNLRDGSPVSGWLLGTLLYEGIKSKSYNDDNPNRSILNDYNLLEGIEEQYEKPVGRIDKTFRMTLSGGMMGSPYWTINGKVYPYTDNMDIKDGEKIRFEYFNMSMMPHPMHLHGHFFDVVGSGRSTGMRIKKDTLIIPPHMGSGAIEFIASNPGAWFHHCHNLYHMEGGMANLVRIIF